MRFILFPFLCLLTLLSSCSDNSDQGNSFAIGVDPTWYPLQFSDTENDHITAFSSELLIAIGQAEGLLFTKETVSWDNLMLGLERREYQAVLSSMPPYLFNQKLFRFSAPYLHLGPVLVVAINSPINSINKLKGKEIAISGDPAEEAILEKSPGVLIRTYSSIPEVLNAIENQSLDGALINAVSAAAYLKDLYRGKLKVVTPPLTEAGLRLIIRDFGPKELIKKFDSGLKKIRESGEYDRLLEKWGLLKSAPELQASYTQTPSKIGF